MDNLEETGNHTFYAEIKNIYKTSLVVEGLKENDSYHRGEFTFGVHEDTQLKEKKEKITFLDLSVGQKICITYTGGVKESYPAQIDNVIKIEVLN